MAELFGRRDGCAHGRGGSMHLLDVERGYFGGWGIVAGQLPIATGLALAVVRQGRHGAVLCELGDGAVNMGAWHESLNLAALWHLPVVFLVVNNEYGMGTSVERASAEPELYTPRRAPSGCTASASTATTSRRCTRRPRRLLARAREERRPAVLEVDDLPLPRPLGGRRRPGLPDEGRGGRAAARATPSPRTRAAARGVRRRRGRARRGRRARCASGSTRPSRSPRPARSPRSSTLAAGVQAPGSDEQFARMRPGSPFGEEELVFDGGARAMSAVAAAGHGADDLPRGAAPGAARGARARRARLRSWARRSASSRAPTRSPPACSTSSGPTACATRRSARRASSALASAPRWRASARWSRS